MKLIHITDTHYGKPSEAIYSREPAANMCKIITEINALHGDAKACFITGDLAHYGNVEAYRYLKRNLEKLTMPYMLILGNHDRRAAFRKVFTNPIYRAAGDFVQYAFELEGGSKKTVLLMLDTVDEGCDGGVYCKTRQEWLEAQLQLYGNYDVYICMHHAPFETGIKAMDTIGLDPICAKALHKILRSHKHIKHIFFGHYHTDISGKWGDISFSTLRGVNHQIMLDFTSARLGFDFKYPHYGVVLLADELIRIHYAELSPC